MDKEVIETLRLGKDSIVTLALELINESIQLDTKASRENFANVKVMTDGKEVFVRLMNPIIYLSQNTSKNNAFYTSAEVNIFGKEVILNQVSHPSDKNINRISFYLETEKIKKEVDFILEAINKSDEIGSIDRSTFEDEMTIYEYAGYYDISVHSKSISSFYKIEKKSGKIYDAHHKHKQTDSDPSENKKEINWEQFGQ